MTRTAVFKVSGPGTVPWLLFVEFSGSRSPSEFSQRINERSGSNRVIELLGMEDELSSGVLGGFAIARRASTLEEAQSFALQGAWATDSAPES
jgi:hypothetical protein